MSSPALGRERIPPDWGGPLSESDYRNLEASWITREIADQAMLRRVDEAQGRAVVGQNGHRDCAGVLIPYIWPGEPSAFNYRLRRDHPDYTCGKDGKPKQERKYLGPPKSGNRLYIPPGVTPDQLQDVAAPVALVEGEKKALALWRLAKYETKELRFIPIAIAGVWNWRGTVGKATGPQGERVDVKGTIADINRIDWKGRKAFVVFDSNVHTNESVKWARHGIARELTSRGADVLFVNLPADCDVNGVDDLLALWGPKRVLELFEKAASGTSLHVVPPPQYKATAEGMFREVAKGEQLTRTQLSNYSAFIKTSIILDDGVETKREFEIAAELVGMPYSFTIPASRFAPMDWPIEHMGPGAITFPHQKDYVRAAIQSFSLTAAQQRIYTHTGWRQIEGRFVYLHANGAIGPGGTVDGVHVGLHGALRRYELQLPTSGEDLIRALRGSLRMLELAPASISFPLRAATCRAVFGDSDFSLHLAGATGVFKSELAALEQQHFGADMNRLHLPGAWSSTGNSLEATTFYAKDALIVIDDFAPQGGNADVARYHAAADRVFRAAGNRAGRGRLDSTARLREPKPPRGLILSTGEDIPRGHSIRARLLILEVSKGDVDSGKLTDCQRDAAAGLYASAMGGFLRWLSVQYEAKRAELDRRASELRGMMLGHYAHARTADMVAHLQAGFEFYVRFAEESGAITGVERHDLMRRCWTALLELAAAQAKHQSEAEPTARFIELVRACLVSGKAHLASRTGNAPRMVARILRVALQRL